MAGKADDSSKSLSSYNKALSLASNSADQQHMGNQLISTNELEASGKPVEKLMPLLPEVPGVEAPDAWP